MEGWVRKAGMPMTKLTTIGRYSPTLPLRLMLQDFMGENNQSKFGKTFKLAAVVQVKIFASFVFLSFPESVITVLYSSLCVYVCFTRYLIIVLKS